MPTHQDPAESVLHSKNGTNRDRVLVTGAAGFGGSNLTRALLREGYDVTGLDIAPPANASLLSEELRHPRFRYLWKSVQDIRHSDIEGHSIVVHMAAQADTPLAFDSPRHTVMQNVVGTIELLEAVRHAGGVSKLLFAGSGNEIGRPHYLPLDERHPLTPHNPYGFSKAAAEMAMWTWRRSYGLPSIVIGTGVVIGPHMRREVFIFKWLWNALQGRPIIVEGGSQTRDVAYIDDVVNAWMLAIRAPQERVVGHKFYAGSGEEYSVERLAEICRDVAGAAVPIEYVGYRPGEKGQREAFSIEKARDVLGYFPRTTPVEAISLTADWARTLRESSPGEAQKLPVSP